MEGIINGIFKALFSPLTFVFAGAFYYVLVWPFLMLVFLFEKAIVGATGKLSQWLFFKDGQFSFATLPPFFLKILIIAVIVFVAIFTIMIVRHMFSQSENNYKDYKSLIQNALLAFSFLFIIPFVFFLGFMFLNFLLETIITGNRSANLSGIIYQSLFKTAPSNDINPFPFIGLAAYVTQDTGDTTILVLKGFILSIMAFTILYKVFVSIISSLFKLFAAFIISPMVVQTIMLDGGQRMIMWRNYVIQNFSAGFILLFAFQIVMTTMLGLETTITNFFTSFTGGIDLSNGFLSFVVWMVLFSSAGATIFPIKSLIDKFILHKSISTEAKPKQSLFKTLKQNAAGVASGIKVLTTAGAATTPQDIKNIKNLATAVNQHHNPFNANNNQFLNNKNNNSKGAGSASNFWKQKSQNLIPNLMSKNNPVKTTSKKG